MGRIVHHALSRCLWSLLIVATALGVSSAWDEECFTPDAQSNTVRQQRMEQMDQFVLSLSVIEQLESGERTLTAEQVLTYSDAARDAGTSCLWTWTFEGLPVALTAIEYKPDRPEAMRWSFELATLSARPVTMRIGETEVREVRSESPVWRALSNAPPPSDAPPIRLLQMKRLAHRFSGVSETSAGDREEFRLMPSPLYHHEGEETSHALCGLFVLVHGTNPEVALALQAVSTEQGPEWQYALTPLSVSKVSVTLDGTLVWEQPRFTGRNSRDVYENGVFPAPGSSN